MTQENTDIISDLREQRKKGNWQLEISLVVISVALSALLFLADGYQIIILNLFFLPVVLAGFFLGRYRAGILAFFCVITSALVIWSDLQGFAAFASPVAIALAITTWGAILGLTTLLVGSLSDELSRKMVEAQEAHIGVVEVLAKYLQSANPNLQNKAVRVSGLCEQVANTLRLPQNEVDNIRLAALLADVENIEVTARVIRKAVGQLDDSGGQDLQKTFYGTDLVNSLGEVLSGVVPILLETESIEASEFVEDSHISAEIVRIVRHYDSLMSEPWSVCKNPGDAIQEMQNDLESHFNPMVLFQLESVLDSGDSSPKNSSENSGELVSG